MSRNWMLKGASSAVLLAALAATPVLAEEATASFDIPAQPLSQALLELGRQARVSVAAPQDLVAGRNGQAVAGDLTTRAALAQLLDGSGLRYEFVGGAAVRIVRADQGPQGGSAGGDVDALIVTAQKREENIQDVPIAISAFSQEDLTRSQVAGGPDLITQVPNMTFTKTNFSSYSIQLRGIGTQAISATTDPAVAVAFNNTPFIRNRFFEQEFYDLQRVEVLRGPQGTLYGRNATAGVVNIISAKPKFFYEAKASADVSNYNSSRVEAMANVPLVEDKVALRLAGAWTKRDGYAENDLTGNPIDGRDLWSTRVSLRVAPTDGVDVNLIWEHFQENDDRLRSGKQLCKKDVVTHVGDVPITDYYDTSTSGGQSGAIWGGVQAALSQGCTRNSLYADNSFQRPNGLMLPYYVPLGSIGLPTARTDPYVSVVNSSDPFVISATNDQVEDLRVIQSTIDPDYRTSSDIGELQISFDLGNGLTLQSETAYGTDTVYSMQDFNRFNTAPGAWDDSVSRPGVLEDGVFCDPQLGCSDRLVAVDVSTADARQFSQEFRLSSDFDGPFNFSVGANFLRADSEDKYYVFINSLSLIAASSITATETQGPYVRGESDNISCMLNGYLPGDPDGIYSVVGCNYMDPNPIGSVNDEGHNYFLSKNPYKLISYAAFGEVYYNLTDNLKITGGLRLTVDKKDAPRIPTWILASNSVGYPVAEVIEQEWSEPTGRLAIDWKPDLSFTDETLLYASFSHGYKAGGANPPGYVRIFYADLIGAADSAAASATRPRTFDPEFVDAYELGSKNTFADGRVTLNLAAFYYDYKDYQISEIVDRSAFNRNFDATVWGLEIEADWRPLDNLRLGFKGGYEKTRIADGEKAIDLMDRTAGRADWLVVRPFPTYASSCVLPTFVFENPNGTIGRVGGVGGGGPSGCEIAYQMGYDPVTMAPYADLANGETPGALPPDFTGIQFDNLGSHPDYPGWDPTLDYGNNNGEGFYKDLGGNELPNAPQFTATITGDYTLPLGADWLATLHTDLHWQSESWWRVFNDHEFSRLDEYFTMNLAAIFTNEEAGWNIMAYVKNVTDETAITGAFLNSDDTGLTTNVFLTEPRLYGVRITKTWTGAPLLGGFGAAHEGPHPLTLELGGQLQRHDAPNGFLAPSFVDAFQAPLDIFDDAQEEDLDWGNGGELKLTWRPDSGPWMVSAGVRYGKTNNSARPSAEQATDPICAFSGDYAPLCEAYVDHYRFGPFTNFSITNRADARVWDHEEHHIVDFAVGRDLGLGGLGRSTLSLGLRYAQFDSRTQAELRGVPDWDVPAGFYPGGLITHTVYDIHADADREFQGAGPTVSWEASFPVAENGDWGRLDLDWSLSGGVLFGTQTAAVTSEQEALYTVHTPFEFILAGSVVPPIPTTITPPPESMSRSDKATAPTVGASLGLSYAVGAFKLGGGYRWERYFDVIDGGYTTHQSYDRTIDGPYFKLSVGFGG